MNAREPYFRRTADLSRRLNESPPGAADEHAPILRALLAEAEAELGNGATANGASSNGAAHQREPLVAMTARALCELPDPPREPELLGPVLVRGYRTLLGGYTGEGKTTLGLQIVRAVIQGERFLEWKGAGGRALIIDAEQGLRTAKRRLAEAGLAKSDEIDYLRVPDGLSLDQDAWEIEQVAGVLEAGRYDVVKADPLYKLHRGDSNDERQAVDLMRRFDAWREQLGFALLMTTHPRKRLPIGGKFTMDEFFGSGAYTRGAEIVLGIQRPRPGYGRLHFFKDRDGDLPAGDAWGLIFDRESGFRRDPDDGQPKPTAAQAVATILAEDPGRTQEQLEAATGYATRTIGGALKELNAVGTGWPKQWRLPAGEQGELAE